MPVSSQRSVTRQIIKHSYAELRARPPSSRHKEQLSLHLPQKFVATDDNSALRTEMLSVEPQEEKAKPRHLRWNPPGWLGIISTRGLTDN
jgi:hypothetical protein